MIAAVLFVLLVQTINVWVRNLVFILVRPFRNWSLRSTAL